MIKARANDLLIFGLSKQNIERLSRGQPMTFGLQVLGLDLRAFIFSGNTEESMAESMKDLIGPDTKVSGWQRAPEGSDAAAAPTMADAGGVDDRDPDLAGRDAEPGVLHAVIDEPFGDGEVQPEILRDMEAIARAIKEFLNPDPAEPAKWGFMLMCVPFGDGEGRCNYMASISRESAIQLMKDQLQRFEAQAAGP